MALDGQKNQLRPRERGWIRLYAIEKVPSSPGDIFIKLTLFAATPKLRPMSRFFHFQLSFSPLNCHKNFSLYILRVNLTWHRLYLLLLI